MVANNAEALKPAGAEAEGFPRVYAVAKWVVIVSLAILAIVAAAFWTMVLGGFAGSGVNSVKPYGQNDDVLVITPECAWPYGVKDHDAVALCKMFNHLTPEQRREVLETRRKNDLMQSRNKQ